MIYFQSVNDDLVMVDAEFLDEAMEARLLQFAANPGELAGMFALMHQHEQRLSHAATDEQRAIGYGDYAYVDIDADGAAVLAGTGMRADGARVFGYIRTLVEIRQLERAAGAEERETNDVIRRTRDGFARGWRYGRWFSVISPGGELGAHHVACLTRMTAAQFQAMQAAGWKRRPVDPELFKRTAPRWNCVDYPDDGPHYGPNGEGCGWCGMTHEEIERNRKDGSS